MQCNTVADYIHVVEELNLVFATLTLSCVEQPQIRSFAYQQNVQVRFSKIRFT